MAIGSNSYGSVNNVLAYTRHLLDGESTFNTGTRPTLAEVETMIDAASAALNVALSGEGLAVPLTQADAKLACDDWVTARVVGMVEMTRQTQAWSGDEGSRSEGFFRLLDSARAFAEEHAPGFKRLGCAVRNVAAQGLTFTEPETIGAGDVEDAPRFRRGMFER